VATLAAVVAVAAGDERDLALGVDGRVWMWEASGHPTPAVVAGLGPVTALAGGRLLSGAVAADGTVWTWGLSMSGTLESPTRIDALGDIVAIIIGVDSNVALRADGTV
jgi:alpha-tubulin suppressor-like RCC1 family protein